MVTGLVKFFPTISKQIRFCFTNNMIEVDLKASEINGGFSLDCSALKVRIIKSGTMYATKLER